MNFLKELIAAFQADKLQLSTLLDVLGSRGAQPDAAHREEVALVEQFAVEGELTPEAAEALLGALRSLQKTGAAPSAIGGEEATVVQPSGNGRRPAADDATMVQPGGPPATPVSHDEDVTVVQPASAGSPADDEATVVKPTSVPPRDVQATHVTGSATGTGTGTSSSFNMDSWQRMADAEGGDFAAVGSCSRAASISRRRSVAAAWAWCSRHATSARSKRATATPMSRSKC